MSELSIIALGVGDTFSAHNTTASLLFEAEGFRLAIDCPDSYRRVLAKSAGGLDIQSIDDVLITHVHGDVEGAFTRADRVVRTSLRQHRHQKAARSNRRPALRLPRPKPCDLAAPAELLPRP